MERVIFYIIAVIMIVFAVAAVSNRKMLRSVIYLLFVLVGVAGIFFLIDYNFLAAVQLTVYAGGIIVLMIFSVLLVHHIELELEVAKPLKQVITAITCLIGIGVVLSTIYTHNFNVVENDKLTTTADVGSKMLSYEAGGFILPFEVISILLLAAMVGAIIIAKGKKLVNKTKD
ncbi:NADH-quinone oxidoreductase subunit J family protein [Seonamhaeicola aphaedonensis]|nr:NADH-quinone oxidoreductase subunit J [Seonamhaeicola aphaedonensis]